MAEAEGSNLPRHIRQAVDAALRTSKETLEKLSPVPRSSAELPTVIEPSDNTESDGDFDESPTKELPPTDLNQVLTGKPRTARPKI